MKLPSLLSTRLLLAFLTMPIAAGALQAQSSRFADDFIRANDDWIGPEWNERAGNWEILGNSLRPHSEDLSDNKLVTHDNIALEAPFRIRTDVASTSGARWGGLTFHVQDAANLYAFRILFQDETSPNNPRYQILRMTTGSWSVLGQGDLAVTGNMRAPDRFYRLQVTSTEPGEFLFQVLEEQDASWVEILNTTRSDSTYSGGVAGFHTSRQIIFNNFLLETGNFTSTPPEPASFSDIFDRPDDTEIGQGWNELVGDWTIVNEELRPEDNTWPPEKLLSYEGLALEAPFEIATEMWARSHGRWGGIAFHVQNSGDYYALRVRFSELPADSEVQLLHFQGGSLTLVRRWRPLDVSGDMLDPAGRRYRMVVGSEAEGDFNFELWEADVDTGELSLAWEGIYTLYGYSGGHAGVYLNADQIVFTAFDLSIGGGANAHPFDAWRAEHFSAAELEDPEISGPSATPAQDGIANLVKYALGLLPWQPSRQAHPRVVWDGDRAALVFNAPEEARAGIELVLAISTDLVQWERHVLDDEYIGLEKTPAGEGRVDVKARPLSSGESHMFLRLEAQLAQ